MQIIPIEAALLSHLNELGYTIIPELALDPGYWLKARLVKLQVGPYLLSMYWDQDMIIVMVADTPIYDKISYNFTWTNFTAIRTDIYTTFCFSIYGDGIDDLLRLLRFAAANTTIPLFMLDSHGRLPPEIKAKYAGTEHHTLSIAWRTIKRTIATYTSWIHLVSKQL